MQQLRPNCVIVKMLGRAYMADGVCRCVFSGSGIAFLVTAHNLQLTLAGGVNCSHRVRAAVFVDDIQTHDLQLDSCPQTISIDACSDMSSHTVLVLKLSEAEYSPLDIISLSVDDNDLISSAPAKKHRIEFIGDSITCGYGIEDENLEHLFSTATENVMKSFCWKTAAALDADCSIAAASGFGIVSGYTIDDKKNWEKLFPPYYGRCGISPVSPVWNFKNFVPDVVVCNLGTNDDSYCGDNVDRQEEFIQGYVSFLRVIREKNRHAAIVCVFGMMGDRLYPAVEMAAERYSQITGDTNISVCRFSPPAAADGLVVDKHPSEKTHDKAVAVLVPHLKNIMGW